MGMTETSTKQAGSQNVWLFGIGFSALSLLAHVFFFAWVAGVIDISSWSPPIRDTPLEISLFRAVPPVAPEGVQPPIERRRDVVKPIRRPPTSAIAAKAEVAEPVDEVGKVEPDVGAEKSIDPKTDAKIELPSHEQTKQEVAPEKAQAPDKTGLEIAEQELFSSGLGAIPVAGAFPYTFYYGDYTLNNALGAGSFIVESGDGSYKLVLIGKTSGLTSLVFGGATYRSEGIFEKNGFAPQRYAEKSGNRAERSAQVDYAAQEVVLGEQKKPTLLGMQDRISVIWQVGLILRAKPEYAERGKTLAIPLMSTRSLDNAQFTSQGVVEIDKRGVLVKAVHFKFKPSNPQNKAQIDLWYDLNNLPQPLRVRWIDERDRTIDIFRDD
jgi:hypothetical protein